MFTSILFSFQRNNSRSYQDLDTRVITLREIKAFTPLRMRRKLLSAIEQVILDQEEKFNSAGINAVLSFLPSSEEYINQFDLKISADSVSLFMVSLKKEIKTVIDAFFHQLIDETYWLSKEEDFRIKTLFDSSPFIPDYIRSSISRWNVGISGEGPFTRKELSLILKNLGVYKVNVRPKENNVIILGRTRYDRAKLSLFTSSSPIKDGRIFTQESFLRYLMFAQDYSYSDLEKNTSSHNGITYVNELIAKGFPIPRNNSSSEDMEELLLIEKCEESYIKQLTGYSVAGDHSDELIRKTQLRKGVALIGLEDVVCNLFDLRIRVMKAGRLYKNSAKLKLESDLNWLYDIYYVRGGYDFKWPI